MLIVIDPIARRADGESVRIARDVLCAGARGPARVALLEQPEQMDRELLKHGHERVVVVGDDRALLRAVRTLYARGEPAGPPLGVVPVGPPAAVAVARGLGLPTDAVRASRTVLGGAARPVDLLEDDAGGVVLGTLGIPAPRQPAARRRSWWPAPAPAVPQPRLRVEADGRVLSAGDRPVAEVSVSTGRTGLADVVVRHAVPASAPRVTARAAAVTVSGATFRYRADAVECGPARARTWRVRRQALRLTLPGA